MIIWKNKNYKKTKVQNVRCLNNMYNKYHFILKWKKKIENKLKK